MSTKANIVVDQGTTFSTTLNLTDATGAALTLTGYSAASQMKRWYTSQNLITFSTSVNGNNGTITLSLDANTTSLLWPGRYMYDVVLTDASNNISRVVEGLVTVTPGVTNDTLETDSDTTSYEAYFSNT